MKKFFAAALVVSMLTVLLSGCMCQVADTTFQFDGSGTVEAKFGFSEEMVNAMNMRAEMTQNGFSYFRYNGHSYYGDQASESFADADEFNAIFAEVSAEIAEVSKAATPGKVTLSVADDGGLTLTVQNDQDDRRAAIKKALAAELPDYSDAQIDALLEDMVMTYRFAFPKALVDYNDGTGITVEENVVTVDYLTLNAGTYRFTTSETESLHQRPLGTVTQESIPASELCPSARYCVSPERHERAVRRGLGRQCRHCPRCVLRSQRNGAESAVFRRPPLPEGRRQNRDLWREHSLHGNPADRRSGRRLHVLQAARPRQGAELQRRLVEQPRDLY